MLFVFDNILKRMKQQEIELYFISFIYPQICSCLALSTCVYPAGLYSNLTRDDSYIYEGIMLPLMASSTLISGLYVGCTPLDALMQSTLECFYQYQCLLQLFNRIDIQPLNSSMKSIYDIHTKVRFLTEKLFIEQWSNEKDFEFFFHECQPNKCSYSYFTRGNVAFIVATTFSLVGGLFVALKSVAPLLLILYTTIARKVKNCLSLSREGKCIEELIK